MDDLRSLIADVEERIKGLETDYLVSSAEWSWNQIHAKELRGLVQRLKEIELTRSDQGK